MTASQDSATVAPETSGLAYSAARVRAEFAARRTSPPGAIAGSSTTNAVLPAIVWFCQREALPG